MISAVSDKPVLDLKTVVYSTDFSHCSRNAGLYAARLAAYFSVKLLVAHAFTLSQAAFEVEAVNRQVSQQRADLSRLLSQEATRLGADSAEVVPTLLDGDPKHAITQLADSNAPSMIVLGTHGRSGLERGIIGSIAETILRSTRWPALTLGPQVQPVTASTLPCKRILFATDFTSAAASAATYAATLAAIFGARIDVLNVIAEDAIEHPEMLAELRNRFYGLLGGLLPRQASAFCDPRTFVAMGSARNRILEHIEEQSIDLLVLGLRKTSLIGMEMRTSAAFQIIVDAPCPVLTIRR